MRRLFNTPTWVLLGVIGFQLIVLMMVMAVNFAPEITEVYFYVLDSFANPRQFAPEVAYAGGIDQDNLSGTSISGTTTQAASRYFTTPTLLISPFDISSQSITTTSTLYSPLDQLVTSNTLTQLSVTKTNTPTNSELSPTPTITPTQALAQGFTPAPSSTPGPSPTQMVTSTNTSQAPAPVNTVRPTSSLIPSSTPVPTATQVATSTSTLPATATSISASTSTSTSTAQPTSTSTRTPNPTATSLPSATATSNGPSPTPTVDLEGCFYNTQSSIENQVLELINQERLSAGVPPLRMNSQLRNSAREHSADMACNSFVSHTGSNGTSSYERIRGHGYYPSRWGENIYMGYQTTPQSVMNWWMDSAPHTANILSPYYVHIGIGQAIYGNNIAYTLNFGSP